MQKTVSFYKLVNVYAQAFFNTFSETIRSDEYLAMQTAYESLIKNHRLISLLQVSFLNHHELKKKCLNQLIDQFALPNSILTLGTLLIDSERMHLLPFILKRIASLYEKKMNIMTMHISCSHTISEQQRKQCTLLLNSFTQSNIRPIFLIDISLIAGIRAQSKTMLWESSIKKMLKSIKAQVKR